MTDRHRGHQPAGVGRSATLNPARASLPASIGYSSTYAGDMHAMPSTTPRHYITTPSGYTTSTTSSGAPTTTRTYAVVTPDSRPHPDTRDTNRTRRSTTESTSRPPVIITTTTSRDRSHAASSHSSSARSRSPTKDEYRPSDGQLYAQPASSLRSRSTARPYHAASATEDYGRFRDRGDLLLSLREIDAYRSSRPSVVYPSDPRHNTAAIDYGDDGYQYTNAGELARYDLDQSKSSRPRRHDSVDRGYYRPNINYNSDQRSFHVNTSHDLSRNYNMNTSRPYEGRAGPPPSTRGFDRISRAYDSSRDVPTAAPIPPSPTTSSQVEIPARAVERWEPGRRSRPLSLHQDGAPRSSHHDEYHPSREDERNMRERLERDAERLYEPPRFRDESVATRGFGIRTDPTDGAGDTRDRRRESWLDDGVDRERSRLRDKVAASLGVAAAAVGLAPSIKPGDKKDQDASEPKRRWSPGDDRERRKEPEVPVIPALPERVKEPERERGGARVDSRAGAQAMGHRRRDAQAVLAGEAATPSSDSDDTGRASRRNRPSNAFDPNDASGLKQLKEQLAAMDASDRGNEGERARPVVEERQQPRSLSPAKDHRPGDSPRDQSRGRELVASTTETKQVRVVSPPKKETEEKPLKSILKQPSAKFPEDVNPVREGVAPHKEDKKLKEAPTGARWTKINRKIVNPEALTIGKERFEIRDDFVIVLRVLSKEEIQGYAAATQVLRERRRSKADGDGDRDRGRDGDKGCDREHDRDQDGKGERRHHRHHRHREDGDMEGSERDGGDLQRRRRHRRDDEDDYEPRARDAERRHSRSLRGRDREHASDVKD